jgi:hypothetical protein
LDLLLGGAQPGDVVAFIQNCQPPLILRKACDDTDFLIEQAYVHGMMHGEIGRKEEYELQEIFLK